LYHDALEGDAHGTRDVKKLSKQSERAADQAQINKTSESVWVSLPEVRHKPRGRPKYSSYTERTGKRGHCVICIKVPTYMAAIT